VRAWWWADTNNFGDMLAPEILEFVTGTRPKLVGRDDSEKVLSVGSVLEVMRTGDTVWGTGWHLGCDPRITHVNIPPGVRFLAVRGPRSRGRLSVPEACPEIYGDPALLLPLFYNPKPFDRMSEGFVPHMKDKILGRRPSECTPDKRRIDLDGNWKDIVSAICACDVIYSSSLHGIVCAEAYGIPAAWAPCEQIIGKEFKFIDYLEGTGRSASDLVPYQMLPPIPHLKEIQSRLLRAAEPLKDL